MKPSIGRLVHYVNYQGTHQSAVITRVNESGSVDLEIFGVRFNSPDRFAEFVYMDEHENSNTWHWPERES